MTLAALGDDRLCAAVELILEGHSWLADTDVQRGECIRTVVDLVSLGVTSTGKQAVDLAHVLAALPDKDLRDSSLSVPQITPQCSQAL